MRRLYHPEAGLIRRVAGIWELEPKEDMMREDEELRRVMAEAEKMGFTLVTDLEETLGVPVRVRTIVAYHAPSDSQYFFPENSYLLKKLLSVPRTRYTYEDHVQEIKRRARLLEILRDRKINRYEQIVEVVKYYYLHKEEGIPLEELVVQALRR